MSRARNNVGSPSIGLSRSCETEQMKMKTRVKRRAGERPQAGALRIEFHDERAQAVAIAGAFNDWRPEATPMVAIAEGRWIKELVLPPGRYEYLLVVDGEWKCDPAAAEQVPNPFGTKNSVLIVRGAAPDTKGPES